MKYKLTLLCALSVQLSHAATTALPNNTFAVDEGVAFTIGNNGASDFVFNWTDSTVTSNILDPKLILTVGETYTFERTTDAHPFAITDDTLPTTVNFGSLVRDTTDSAVITTATLSGGSFVAQPSGGSTITWTPTAAEIDDYFYTCTVTGHTGMTGSIQVVDAVPEPSSSLLALLGSGFLFIRRRR